MKKIKLVSKIIFVFQCLIALYFPIWRITRALKVDIMLYVMMYGIYASLPVAIVGALCSLFLVFKYKIKKDVIKSIVFVLLQLLLGFWNYMFYNSLSHI